MNILLLYGNNQQQSLDKCIFKASQKGAEEVTHTVTPMEITGMQFDPVLHEGSHIIQTLEPHLVGF